MMMVMDEADRQVQPDQLILPQPAEFKAMDVV